MLRNNHNISKSVLSESCFLKKLRSSLSFRILFIFFPLFFGLSTVSFAQEEGEDVTKVKKKFKEKISQTLKKYNPKNVYAELKEKVKKVKDWKNNDPLKMTGGAGLSLRGYNAFGGEAGRQSPFNWTVNANLNISIYEKINVPFSLAMSAQAKTGTVGNPLPPPPDFKSYLNQVKNSFTSLKDQFVRVGASPMYKWATVHLGHRSMNFSSLTYANQTFYGVGTDLSPGKYRIKAMRGIMPTAEPVDLSLFDINTEVFNRRATTVQLGYGDDKKFLDVIYMKGKDLMDAVSISLDSTIITPEENSVIAFNGQWPILESLNARLEIASSAFTKNAFAESIDGGFFLHPGFVMPHNASTTYSTAINGGWQFQGRGFNLGMDYQKFDPGYKTFGVYYFNDDLQNITGNIGFTFSKIQLVINGSAGLQTNNLDQSKQTTVSRTIGSANLTWSLKNLSTNFNYNNFSNSVEYVLNPSLDSLNAVVITENMAGNVSYTLSTKSKSKHSITLSGTSQVVNSPNPTPGNGNSTGSQMYTGNLAYNISPEGNGIKWTLRSNYNQNQLSGLLTDRVGFGLGASKNLLDNKISLRLDNDYFIATTPDSQQKALTSRLSANYKINAGQTLALKLMVLNRNQEKNGILDVKSELTAGLQYNYRFKYSLKERRDKKGGSPEEGESPSDEEGKSE